MLNEEILTTEDRGLSAIQTRFQDAPWVDNDMWVTLGGLGGVGGFIAEFLAKQGLNLQIIDCDTVETYNVGNQNYSIGCIGENKVDSIIDLINGNSSTTKTLQFDERLTKDNIHLISPTQIVVSAFDSMEGRKMLIDWWYLNRSQFNDETIFIDTRINAESFWCYLVTPDNYQRYLNNNWKPDDQMEDLVCTYKGTAHCGSMCGATAVSLMNNWIANLKTGDNMRAIPYCIKVNLQLFMYETEY